MGDALPPVALSRPGLSQPIGYQSSCFLKQEENGVGMEADVVQA